MQITNLEDGCDYAPRANPEHYARERARSQVDVKLCDEAAVDVVKCSVLLRLNQTNSTGQIKVVVGKHQAPVHPAGSRPRRSQTTFRNEDNKQLRTTITAVVCTRLVPYCGLLSIHAEFINKHVFPLPSLSM